MKANDKELARKIKETVDKNLEEALKLFKGTRLEDKALSLKGRLNDLKQEEIATGNIDRVEQNKIRKNVIDLADMLAYPEGIDGGTALDMRYSCDRSPQKKRFSEVWDSKRDKPLCFFVIHGPTKQNHQGFFKYLDQNYFRPAPEAFTHFIKLSLPPDARPEDFKGSFMGSLYEVLKNKQLFPSSNMPKRWQDMSVVQVMNVLNADEHPRLAISIQVTRSGWNESLPAFLHWFLREFCQKKPNLIQPNKARMYIFFMIKYEEGVKGRFSVSKFLKRSGTDPDSAFRKNVTETFLNLKIPQYTCFPELEPVTYKAISAWMYQNLNEATDTDREDYLKKYFSEGEKHLYQMDHVFKQLAKVVNQYNEEFLLQQAS